MRKKRTGLRGWTGKLFQTVRIMKITLLLVLLSLVQLQASVSAQLVSVKLKNASLQEIFEQVKRQTGVSFMFSNDDVRNLGRRDFKVESADVNTVMERCLAGTGLTFEIVDNVVIVRKMELQEQTVERAVAKGYVKNNKGELLPGVTIAIKGTTLGTVSDGDGHFKLEIPKRKDIILVFTFVGMKRKEVPFKNEKEMQVVMEDESMKMDEVVVTGYANIDKKSFTGASVTIDREELLKVSKSNVLMAIQSFDPSFRIQKNNEWGSDPNTVPEVYIRGRSGMGVRELDKDGLSKSQLENNPNLPTFILDGFEVSVEKIYDMDPNRIESITTLKDAAATAMYGSRAANGVVVITTVAPKPGRVMVSYAFTGSLTLPDLSDYNLANAAEKLEIERRAGLFEPKDYDGGWGAMEEYNRKLQRIKEGVDTDWLSIPLQNTFEHQHSVFIEGGNKDLRYGIKGVFHNTPGVMKHSFRKRAGTGFFLDYRLKNLQVTNDISYTFVRGDESPYGNFSDYSKLQPYDRPYDENGNLIKELEYSNVYGSSKLSNPLYERQLGNYDFNKYDEFVNNLRLNWYVTDYLTIKGQFSVTKQSPKRERFIDPLSAQVSVKDAAKEDQHLVGDLYLTMGDKVRWDANAFVYFQRAMQKHNINFAIGINVLSAQSQSYNTHYRGFPSGELHSPNYAAEVYSSTKSESLSRMFSGVASLNYTFNNIYLLDAAARFDGSSEFGSNQKWAPFWSAGLGVNIHNYPFLENNAMVTMLKLRASYGQTGKVNFAPYCATTIYQSKFSDKTWYSTGYGVVLKALGNPDLTWETTNKLNVGLDLELFNRLIYLETNYYHQKTVDLITDVTLPASSGFSTYKDNMGEVENKGVELMLRINAINTKDWQLMIWGNLAHNKNKILKISDSQKAYNDRVNDYYADAEKKSQIGWAVYDPKYARPISKYEEGGSLTSIFAMKSLGIDPMNGKEMYMNRDGSVSYAWSASQQIIAGNTEPKAQGAFGFNLSWKNLSFFTSFMYEWGAQSYNTTLVNDVENADIENMNVDRRVLTDRWNKPGDIAPLKDIKDRSVITLPSTRFIQDNNILTMTAMTLSYDFPEKVSRKLGMSLLRIEASTNDIANFSTIRQERGLSYPFAKQINFSLKANF